MYTRSSVYDTRCQYECQLLAVLGPGSMCLLDVRTALTTARRLDLMHATMVLLLSVCISHMSSMLCQGMIKIADKSVELSVHHRRRGLVLFSCLEFSARGGRPQERSTTRRHRRWTNRCKEARKGRARACYCAARASPPRPLPLMTDGLPFSSIVLQVWLLGYNLQPPSRLCSNFRDASRVLILWANGQKIDGRENCISRKRRARVDPLSSNAGRGTWGQTLAFEHMGRSIIQQ